MRCSASARAVSMQIGIGDDALEVARELEPGLAGHHDVEDDEIEGEAAHGRPGASGVAGRRDAEAVVLQEAREQIADALVVVDDQDVRRRCRAVASLRARGEASVMVWTRR